MTQQNDRSIEGLIELVKDAERGASAMIVHAGGRSFYDAQEARNKAREAIRTYAAELVAASLSALPAGGPTQEQIVGAVARGWCHPINTTKVMDPALAVAISQEVCALLSPTPEQAAPDAGGKEAEIRKLAKAIIDEAFNIPPINPHTPRIVMLADAISRLAQQAVGVALPDGGQKNVSAPRKPKEGGEK